MKISRKLPSVHSYQGRYFYMALLIGVLLAGITWFGRNQVTESSEKHITSIQKRAETKLRLAEINNMLRQIEDLIYWQLLDPNRDRPVQLANSLAVLDKTLNKLNTQEYGKADHTGSRFTKLRLHIQALSINIDEFLAVSTDISRRFPGISLMKDRMLPESLAARQLLSQSLNELSNNPDNKESLVTLYRMRDELQAINSEFRLLVANRFGVFSDTPQDGINARLENVLMFMQQYQQDINQMEAQDKDGQLFLADPMIWQQLRQHANNWFSNMLIILDELAKDDWRQDLYIYRTGLKPVLEDIKLELEHMASTLNAEAEADVKDQAELSHQLSNSVLILALASMFVLIYTYYYLKSKIIRPIAETTLALKMESIGSPQDMIPTPSLEETRNLVEAFHEMRQQVWLRQERLDHMAHHDPLTGLPNRMLLRDRLSHALEMARRYGQMLALMFIDLDNFKQVNDSLGHLAGDKLLEQVAARLANSVRISDTVARISGDEFAILVEDIGSRAGAMQVAENILESLQPPMRVEDNELHISCSVGIAMAPMDDEDPNTLMRDADTAMYEAKRLGRARFCFFSTELAQKARQRMDLEQKLRLGVENREFNYHFQPIMNIRDGSLHCIEALIRWQPAGKEIRYPGSFLPTLLEMGLGSRLDPVLLGCAAQMQLALEKALGYPIVLSLNMSANALRSEERHGRIINALTGSGIKLDQLIIEVTEDCLVEDINFATNLLNRLKSLGVRIALDDFGTGQSSLNHLRSFPFDIVKIDREFIRDLTEDVDDAGLVKTIIDLAHQFGAEVVAEGVETQEQYEALQIYQCDHVQGYWLGKPMPANELTEFLSVHYSNAEKSSSAM